jgi:tetratricopeptide (TPR) repeat protein
MAWDGLGNDYSEIKSYNEAIEAYRQAVRINPELAGVWNNLGVAYARSGNRSAALEAIRELRRLDPEQADRLFNGIMPR